MSRPVAFKRVVIVGLGLLGGSVGLALRQRKLAKRVVALGRDLGRLRPALQAGLVDEISVDDACVKGADLIVLCGPFKAFEAQLKRLSKLAPAGCLVTDVGSVKGPAVARWHKAAGALTFVASHPMAGGEKTGWRHARPDLFEGAAVLLTPLKQTQRSAVLRLGTLWQALGADVALTAPDEHDRLVARVSHLPHAAAFALAAGAAQGGRLEDFAYAGKGWFDTTRVAGSDPELWTDVFLHHPGRLDAGLAAVQGQIQALRKLIKAGKPGPLKAWLAKAAKARQATEGKPR